MALKYKPLRKKRHNFLQETHQAPQSQKKKKKKKKEILFKQNGICYIKPRVASKIAW
jgi:hypothetical protein